MPSQHSRGMSDGGPLGALMIVGGFLLGLGMIIYGLHYLLFG